MIGSTTDEIHRRLWQAIDAVAARNGLSPSALARRAGLSSTAFNKSKRVTADGRPRWPSTESIAKILETTGSGVRDLLRLCGGRDEAGDAPRAAVPFLAAPGRTTGFAEGEAGAPPAVLFPDRGEAALFAFEIADEAARPFYRRGDVLIASATAPLGKGDRVLVRTCDGGVAVRLFVSLNGRSCTLAAPDRRRRHFRLPRTDVVWIARILWASQ